MSTWVELEFIPRCDIPANRKTGGKPGVEPNEWTMTLAITASRLRMKKPTVATRRWPIAGRRPARLGPSRSPFHRGGRAAVPLLELGRRLAELTTKATARSRERNASYGGATDYGEPPMML